MYNNKLACKTYYNKRKDDPDFVMKKRLFARSQYYRKRYKWFYKIFQAWKLLERHSKVILHEEIKLYYILIKWRLLKIRNVYNKELLELVFSLLKKEVKPKPIKPQIVVCF